MPLPWEYLDQIRRFEGDPNSPSFYRPQWDYRQNSIGYGTRYRPGQDMSRGALENDFNREFGAANQRVRDFAPNVTPGQEAALSSLTYNQGPSWMNQGLGGAVLRGDWQDAQRRFLQYINAGGQPNSGLIRRRQAEAPWLSPLGAPRMSLGAAGLGDAQASYQPTATPLISPDIIRAASPENLPNGPADVQGAYAQNLALSTPPQEPIQDFSTVFPGAAPNAPLPPVQWPSAASSIVQPDNMPPAPPSAPLPVSLADSSVTAPGTTQDPFDIVTGAEPSSAGTSGGGIAPAAAGMGGGGFGQWIQGLGTNPLFMGGLTMLAGQGPSSGANIANQAITQRRAETLFGQQQTEYLKRQQIWNDAFPNGAPNPNHQLLKDIPPVMAATIYSMGPEQGLPLLGQLQLKGALARQEMERKLELAQKLAGGGLPGSGGTGTAPAAPAAMPAPTVAPTNAPAEAPAMAPSAAPQMQGGMPGPAPVSVSPGGQVMIGNQAMSIPQAEQTAVAWEIAGIPTGELRAAITRAAAPGQAAATKTATELAERQLKKPKERETTSALVEGLDRMEALAQKIHDNPALQYATGMWAQPGRESAHLSIPWTSEGSGIPLRFWGVTRPGSPTADVERDMTTLSQQIGLSTLQALKQASSTGASGLGSTSEPEINMLKNAIAGIGDPYISKEKYQENLRIIMTSAERIRARMMGAWQETYGEPFREANGQTPPGYPTTSSPRAPEKPAGYTTFGAPRSGGIYGLAKERAAAREAQGATPAPSGEITVGGKKRKYVQDPNSPSGYSYAD